MVTKTRFIFALASVASIVLMCILYVSNTASNLAAPEGSKRAIQKLLNGSSITSADPIFKNYLKVCLMGEEYSKLNTSKDFDCIPHAGGIVIYKRSECQSISLENTELKIPYEYELECASNTENFIIKPVKTNFGITYIGLIRRNLIR